MTDNLMEHIAHVDVIVRGGESYVGDLLNEVAAVVRERALEGRGRPIGADLHAARIAQVLAQVMGWRPASREYRAAVRAAVAYCAGGHAADVEVILARRAAALRQGVQR